MIEQLFLLKSHTRKLSILSSKKQNKLDGWEYCIEPLSGSQAFGKNMQNDKKKL